MQTPKVPAPVELMEATLQKLVHLDKKQHFESFLLNVDETF